MISRKLFGPPGTGKTTRLLKYVKTFLKLGTPIDKIGYFAFTTKAANEAVDRMLDYHTAFQKKDLKHFRTLHSLAFNQLGMKKAQVMQDEHYEDIGRQLGIEVTVYSGGEETTGFINSDSEYFNLINAARIKKMSIEEEYNTDMYSQDMDKRLLQIISDEVDSYKRAYGLVDFTDMIEKFIVSGLCPKYDVAFIDEAQDLSSVQRLFFDKHIEGNKVKIFVGDDKQTIYHETSLFDDIGDNAIYRYTHTFRFGYPLIGIINRYGTLHTASGTNQTRLMPVQTVDDIDAFFYVLISSWKDIIGFDLSNFELEDNDIKKIQGKVAKHRAYLKMSEQYARVSNKDLTKEQFFTARGALDLLDFHQEKWLFIEEKIKEMKSKKRKRGAKKNIIKTIHGSKGKEYNNVFIDPSCLPEYNNHPASWKKKDRMYYTAITRAKKRLYFMGKFYEPFYTTHLIEKCRENPMFVLPKSYEKYRESFLNEARRQQK